MRQLRTLVCCLLALVVCVFVPTGVRADKGDSGVPRFDQAVDRAVAFLKNPDNRIAETHLPLVAYALMKAGEPKDSPIVARGIAMSKARGEAAGYIGYEHVYQAGVDAMLLADSDPDAHFAALQSIARYLQSAQNTEGFWMQPERTDTGDVSMSQYGVLGLWAAVRAGCQVSAQALDRAASFHLKNGSGDGGWPYRPGTTEGPGSGMSTHNMTLAGCGSVSVVRLLLHGPKAHLKKEAPEKKFGVLEKVTTDLDVAEASGSAFPGYKATNNAGALDDRAERAIEWNTRREDPISKEAHRIYFYYALERAASLNKFRSDWFTFYGDGLLTLQAEDGSFATHSGPNVGTAFAILYFTRSTQQVLGGLGVGEQTGNRDLLKFMNPDGRKKKEIGPLDELLAAIEGQDFASLDIDTSDIVEKVQFGSPEELVGQVENLKKLLKNPDAEKRQVAYWALGRTGDFSMVPLMLEGLRDPSVDVNADALEALKFIARKPRGFGLPSNPLDGLEEDASEERRLEVANAWRTKAYKVWGNWYTSVRPYQERDGLDELLRELP
ncbi:MAG: HEAT repeat domain-containing protein [Planctomycetaceae bacterium]